MMFNYLFAFIALVGSSISDVRTREVPDMLSISSVFVGFASILVMFILNKNVLSAIDYIAGFLVAIGVALLMFHTGQWGGGDAKLLMGLGMLFGLTSDNYFFINSAILVIITGAVYGLVWAIIAGLKYRRAVLKEFKGIIRTRAITKLRKYSLFVLAILLIAVIFADLPIKILSASIIIMYYLIFYFSILVSSVEKGAMIKKIPVKKVTEGDWIAKDIVIKGKYVCGPKDKGISRKQIRQLKKLKVKNVFVKYGMPFVPVFLIAFAINYYLIFIKDISLLSIIITVLS